MVLCFNRLLSMLLYYRFVHVVQTNVCSIVHSHKMRSIARQCYIEFADQTYNQGFAKGDEYLNPTPKFICFLHPPESVAIQRR